MSVILSDTDREEEQKKIFLNGVVLCLELVKLKASLIMSVKTRLSRSRCFFTKNKFMSTVFSVLYTNYDSGVRPTLINFK